MSGVARPNTRFGLFIGQVGLSWPELVERFRLADELGFDHAWLVDHLMPTDPPHDRSIFEAWTSLSALAAMTTQVRLGVLVSSNTFRHPSLLAKQAVTVDHISGGPVDPGHWDRLVRRRASPIRTGVPGRPRARGSARGSAPGHRLASMSGEAASHDGRFYRLDDATALPRSVQRPRIPVLIAAHRPRMLRLAARYADIWDTFPTIEGTATEGVSSDLSERVAAFEEACHGAGRDAATVRRSVWVGSDPLESPAGFLQFVDRHRSLGFTDLMIALPSNERWSTVKEIATTIIPRLRAEEASPHQFDRDRPSGCRGPEPNFKLTTGRH